MSEKTKVGEDKKLPLKMPTSAEKKLVQESIIKREVSAKDDELLIDKKGADRPEQNYRVLKWVAVGLIGLAVACLIFWVGMVVGGSKARFSYRWAENYHNNFAGPGGGFLGDWQQKLPPQPTDFIEGHGVFGQIIELRDNSFVMRGQKDMEEIVIVTKGTIIKDGAKTINDGLKVGEYVVVIGSPNKTGQIESKLIRLFRNQPQGPGPSLTPRGF